MRFFLGSVLLLTLLILMSCFGMGHLVAFALMFVFGGIKFTCDVLPRVRVNWQQVASGIICSLLLLIIADRFLKWLLVEMTRPTDEPKGAGVGVHWRFRWTAAGFVVFILMFVSGMAAIGIAHQSAWLLQRPIFQKRIGRVDQVKCAASLRTIWQGLEMWFNDRHDRYPITLKQLAESGYCTGEDLVCPASTDLNGQNGSSYVYLAAGSVFPLESNRVVVLDMLENHNQTGINALFADGRVEWFSRDDAERLMLQLGFRRVAIEPREEAGR